MRFSVLASGSAANSTYVEVGETRILIDCGLSARQIGVRLDGLGVDVSSVEAILLTHEHSDHIAGIRVLSNRLRIPVYTTEETAAEIHAGFLEDRHANATGKRCSSKAGTSDHIVAKVMNSVVHTGVKSAG
jgi:phosphoribosyl 1,2-cyclic phosphodiesterase